MSSNVYNGFYYIEGDKYIGTTMSYEKILETGTTYKYADIISRFTIPVVLSYTNGLTNSKYIIEEDADKTRSQIDLSKIYWKKVFAIANYIYNRTNSYIASGSQYIYQDGVRYTLEEYVHSVLSGIIKDPNITNYSYYDIYNCSILLPLVINISQSSTFNYFTFYVKDPITEVISQFTMNISPNYFITNWEQITPTIYVYYKYNESNDDLDIVVNELKNRVATLHNIFVLNYLRFSTKKYELNPVTGKYDIEKNIYFYIFSNISIPLPEVLLNDSKYKTAIQNIIKSKEPTVPESILVQKYPTIFEETTRVIYPMTESDNRYKYDDEALILNPIGYSDIKYIVENNPYFVGMKKYDVTNISVLETSTEITRIIPFIAGGINGGLKDKIPFFRPTRPEIAALEGYEPAKIEQALNFNTYVERILKYQLFGESIDDLMLLDINLHKADSYCSFDYCGITWKVINRKYNPSTLGE